MADDPAAARDEGWLFSPQLDASIWLLPFLTGGLVAFVVMRIGQRELWTAAWGWSARYAFGNTTHVILSFLLVGVRRDIFRANPDAPWKVGLGSLAAFAASFAVLSVEVVDAAPRFSLMVSAGIFVLALHHTVSQTRGFWALYGVKSPLGPKEFRLQRAYSVLALVLLSGRTFAVAEFPGKDTGPTIDVGQAEGGALPFLAFLPLLAAWAVYGLLLLRGLAPGSSPAKKTYLVANWTSVAWAIVFPAYGLSVLFAIHGVEYFLLTWKMLAPDERARRGWVVPAMGLSIVPLLWVGLTICPFLSVSQFFSRTLGGENGVRWVIAANNSVVLAHYWADAFLYRFRIPGIRRVMLSWLVPPKPEAAV